MSEVTFAEAVLVARDLLERHEKKLFRPRVGEGAGADITFLPSIDAMHGLLEAVCEDLVQTNGDIGDNEYSEIWDSLKKLERSQGNPIYPLRPEDKCKQPIFVKLVPTSDRQLGAETIGIKPPILRRINPQARVFIITISNQMNYCHRRFAIAKELVHALTDVGDCTNLKNGQSQGLKSLLDAHGQLRRVPSSSDITSPDTVIHAEDFGLVAAKELLVPFRYRGTLKYFIDNHMYSPKDLALKFGVPAAIIESFCTPIGDLSAQVNRTYTTSDLR